MKELTIDEMVKLEGECGADVLLGAATFLTIAAIATGGTAVAVGAGLSWYFGGTGRLLCAIGGY